MVSKVTVSELLGGLGEDLTNKLYKTVKVAKASKKPMGEILEYFAKTAVVPYVIPETIKRVREGLQGDHTPTNAELIGGVLGIGSWIVQLGVGVELALSGYPEVFYTPLATNLLSLVKLEVCSVRDKLASNSDRYV